VPPFFCAIAGLAAHSAMHNSDVEATFDLRDELARNSASQNVFFSL
jgi:hypothetical protein